MEQRLQDCLRIALKYDVSDIHMSLMKDKSMKVEMRIHGTIIPIQSKKYDTAFFHYLLYRANLDVSKARLPQTGCFETVVDGKPIALRFAIVSGFAVTSGVLRILNHNANLSISNLAIYKDSTNWLKSIPNHRVGLFIFSGPTGSGKTTTMYTILNSIQGKKIFTLEDPVEVYSSSYIQLAVNERGPFTYEDGIKQLMRHDPDIIMIGEIRDEKAANMAIRCALTGHLVLTSIHASSCVGAIHRMLDLHVDKSALQTTLAGISNQRLYDTYQNTKASIFEYMDKKEVNYYFDNNKTSENFITLQEKINFAADQKIISKKQAKEDMS